MKKLIVALCLLGTVSSPVLAWNHGYYGYRGPVYVNNYGYNNNWVAPALAGVVVGAALARPYYYNTPVYYTPPPVVYTQPTVYVQQPNPAPSIPEGYRWTQVLDPACNCYKYALVPN
jgi:hypothetical protein